MKKVVLAVLCLVGVTVPALAQDYPKGEIFAGYSYLRADLIADHVNAHGFLVSVTGNLHKNFGIEGEIGGHYGNTPAGFPAGNIALISRGACTFALKATNAYNAGASGVVIYNRHYHDLKC